MLIVYSLELIVVSKLEVIKFKSLSNKNKLTMNFKTVFKLLTLNYKLQNCL